MNTELQEAIAILEKEKNITREALLEGIRQSLIQAYRYHFGKSDNCTVEINAETCEYAVYASKTVVENVEDPVMEISLLDAKKIDEEYELGDTCVISIQPKEFGRIATQNAKNVVTQKIREEERRSLFERYKEKEHNVITGTVARINGKNIAVNLGKADGLLNENEMVKGENLRPHDRIKVYVMEVKDSTKGPRILLSRKSPELVRKLFEAEVAEIADGIIEIRGIAREAGSRTKMAVYSNDPDVDAVGACVGTNGTRVNNVVDELGGEKVDIINWNENPACLIENALSPAKVIAVFVDPDEKTSLVVVPDHQLSLAIGKEGQNARLSARLTGYNIDIKSETQAREAGLFDEYLNDDEDEEFSEEEFGAEGPEEEEQDPAQVLETAEEGSEEPEEEGSKGGCD